MFLTERLCIEPLALTHADGLLAALDHPDVGRFIGGPDVTTLGALHERIAYLTAGPASPRPHERWWNFAVRLHADHTIIGRLEATTYGAWGEIAYVFGPRYWGHGLASEATRWLIHHLANLGAPELWAAVEPANHASQRLLLRLTFTPTGPDPARPLGSFAHGDCLFVRRPPPAPA